MLAPHSLVVLGTLLVTAAGPQETSPRPPPANLALVASATTSFVSGHETVAALNDGSSPRRSNDKSRGAYGNWPRRGTQWVEYAWNQPVSTDRVEVYWFDDRRGVRLPRACRLLRWDGAAFVPVEGASPGLADGRFNEATFPEVTTSRLRLEMEGDGEASTGILEWRVLDSGKSPNFPPGVEAGVDRVAVLPAGTFLEGRVKDDGKANASPTVRWSMKSGPGPAVFADPAAASTTARFPAPGDYVLELTADDGQATASDTLHVRVDATPPAGRLDLVPTTAWKATGPLWPARLKAVIVNWIPHCIRKIEEPGLREGGLENFDQAARKLAGDASARHQGWVFANAWVYNTLESMCLALLLDAQGDPEILAAQEAMRKTIEGWIPRILAAQEPDGYLHTVYTIRGTPRWTRKPDHEGYNAGYFIEAALAHFRATGGKDARLLDAARRMADLWCDKIGPPPRKRWYEGHQAMEMALVKLARFVDAREGAGKGRRYLDLAKFLLDTREEGEEYDQSHVPVVRQYEAVGHAVRAVYSYAAMADVAMETGDPDYHGAVKSIWSNIVHRKYYVTGGVGSGETSEGFGKDYSLPNRAYCESCSGCGEMFFQYRMHLAYREARHADLLEETLFNAVLGSIDLEGRNFTYTNALDSDDRRYLWHNCPCCVGNIPRTLLELPTWMYSRGEGRLYVNLYAGSAVDAGEVAGVPVRVVQATDYPWSGKVSLELHPASPRRFRLMLRAPERSVSDLYSSDPPGDGIESVAMPLLVNEAAVPPAIENGYWVVDREWKAGDRVELVLPMPVQRVKATDRIASTSGRVALRRGPLVYNIESADQDLEKVLDPAAPLTAEWKPDLLGGVMAIQGKFADGSPLTAIPNYARLNRGGRSIVWIKDR